MQPDGKRSGLGRCVTLLLVHRQLPACNLKGPCSNNTAKPSICSALTNKATVLPVGHCTSDITSKKKKIYNGNAGVPPLPLSDVRAGDRVVRPHVLPEVRRGLPAFQMSAVQREAKTKGGEKHEEQRLAHRRRGKVLARREGDEVPNSGETQSHRVRGSVTLSERGAELR